MAATSVIPHSPTGEQPHFTDELHTLLEQLDDTELVALATVIFATLEPQARDPLDAAKVRLLIRRVKRADRAHLVEALAEFALLLIARKSCQ